MTAAEAYDLTTKGGAGDFARLIEICESSGDYCLIGGLAVNCYVEPVYTLDADLVVVGGLLHAVHAHSVNAVAPDSQLRIQFTIDERYQPFVHRARRAEVLGVDVRVASLEDVTQGKLWAYGDPKRRLSKRKKDERDLIRLAEAYPQLVAMYPPDLREQIERG
ncbi:MAG TPA: hypothetical protein DEH78_13895 [Solibacterales bacterium]|nr:hypothetical protein [Bryobacterales bacterium]